jgi:hypothetical protein
VPVDALETLLVAAGAQRGLAQPGCALALTFSVIVGAGRDWLTLGPGASIDHGSVIPRLARMALSAWRFCSTSAGDNARS